MVGSGNKSFRGSNHNKRGGRRGDFKRGRGGRHFNVSDANKGRVKFEKTTEYRHQEQLTEEEVGISEYISKLEGYSAVIKARFSDFQVNEINIDGKMAKLTDTSIPKTFTSLAHKYSFEDVKDSPLDKIPQSTWEALRNLVLNSNKASDNVPVELEADNLSKDDRKSIHVCVKSYFGKEIVASTVTRDEKTILVFKKYDKQKKDNRLQWPEDTPEFVHFIVYKEMMDTMDACFKIAGVLKIPPLKIAYAGVKDKRAKTTQWFSIKKYEPAKIVSKTNKIRNLHVGNIEFKENPLKIGQLSGNKFRIALRNVIAEDDLIINSLTYIKEHGYINYYGLQRFGNDKEVPTFSVGIKLLQGEWKEAVNLILKVKTADDPSLPLNQAKKLYAETGDAAKAVMLCDERHNSLEKKLLEGLEKQGQNDYVNALENIPRNMRLMYIHAYQSLIWNKMASKRIREFGLQPVEGDLIFVGDLKEEEPLVNDAEDSETESTEQEPISKSLDDTKKDIERPSVRPLVNTELDKYTIFDIVLPLPGYDVVYPENLKQYYKEAIEECGLTLEMPKQRVKTYNLSGAYRKLVQHAKEFEWKIMHYNDPTDNLIRSDLEELKGQEEPKSVEGGKYKAVVVEFVLSPSSYATMVLREILKCNTSSSAQAGLNDYGEKKSKVIVENTNGTTSENQIESENQIDEVQEGSLLADKARYDDFKSNLFKDILGETDAEGSNKRELETEENDLSKKKLKTDEKMT